jgi:hypothetical protein
METEYEAILGIVVTHGAGRGRPISALFVGHSELSVDEEAVGFDINNNDEANIKLLKPIDKSLEELMDDYQVSGRCDKLKDLRDQLDYLHWLGYAYVMKNYPDNLPGKPPLLVISNPRVVNLDIWKEISSEEVVREINDRTNVVGENK